MSSFNDENGYIPSTIEELLAYFKEETNLKFPNVDLENYENSTYWATQYGAAQENIKNGNNLITIEEAFYTFLALEQNKIKSSKVSTQIGIIQSLLPFTDSNQVQVHTPNPAILEIYIDEKAGADEIEIAQTILNNKSAGDFTKNSQGQTNTTPVPIPEGRNRIVQAQNSAGQPQNIYWALPNKIPLYIQIYIETSQTYLQVNNDVETIRNSFINGMKALDQYGLPFYGIGKDFEPEKYLSESVLTFASDFTFKTSLNNIDWQDGRRLSIPGDLFEVLPENITPYINGNSILEEEKK